MWKSLSGKSSESSSSRRKPSEPSRRSSESFVSSSSSRKSDRKRSERDRDRDRAISSQHPSSSQDRGPHDVLERSSSVSYATAIDTRRDERTSDRGVARSNTFPATATNSRKEDEDGWVDEDDVASNATKRSKHRKRSSSRERKYERRARSSSREKDDKRRGKKSSSSNKLDGGIDGQPFERSQRESIANRGGDFEKTDKVVMRANSEGQKKSVPYMTDSSTWSSSRDPNQQPSRMDPHVSSQFPGQDSTQSSAPYRPALSPAGGFGLAADYYGDQGQSVAHQPGVRTATPVLAGTQPHLQSASAVPAPPQETGHGLADDYYMSGALGDSQSGSANPSSSRPTKPPGANGSSITPDKYGKTSNLGQTVGATAAGAAAGYAMSNDTAYSQSGTNGTFSAGHQHSVGTQMPYQTTATFAAGGQNSQYDHSTSAPALPTLGSAYAASASAKPNTKPSKSSSQHSNAPLYAAAAGLAGAAAYQHYHHNDSHHDEHHAATLGSSTHRPHSGYYGPSPSPYAQGGLGMKHRHQGPVDRLVDWWRDYEDVQKMEEYTEYIGVCRYCFDPRSNPIDAPRKHHYKRRRSSESLRGSRENLARRSTDNLSRTSRVDKTSRYDRYDYSSDEGRRRRSKSGNLVAAGLGAYGLGKLGKSFFSSGDDFDDTYSVRSGRFNESSTSLHHGHQHGPNRIRSDGHERFVGRSEYGVIGSEHSHHLREHVAHRPGHGHVEKQLVRRHPHSRSRSRSHSRDRKSALMAAGLGAAAGASMVGSSHRHRSKSPNKEVRVERRRPRENSPQYSTLGVVSKKTSNPERQFVRRHEREKSPSMFSGFFGRSSPSPKRRGSRHHGEKKTKGFFNFSNSSTSSAGSDLVYGSKLDLTVGSRLQMRRSSPRQKVSTRDLRKGECEDINKTLLGIGATAAALGALSARDKGKSRMQDIYMPQGGRSKVGKPTSYRRTSTSHAEYTDSVDSDAAWESASAGEDSESGASLAFGDSDLESHVVKSRKSTDSLVSNDSGLNILGWRFGGSGKKKRRSNSDLGRRHASEPFPAPSMVGRTPSTSYYPQQSEYGSVMSSTSNLPTMQNIPPQPIESFDSPALGVPDFSSPTHHRHSSIPLSPRHHPEDPMIVARPDPVPLQQPQPVKPVSPPKYTAPTGAPVFASNSDVSRKSSRRRASRTTPSEHESPNNNSNFARDALLAGAAGVAGVGLASAMSRRDGKRKEQEGAVSGYDNLPASQVRFDESREHPERGNKEPRQDRERRERREAEERVRREEEIRKIEGERKAREDARVTATRKRDEDVERKARERREADLARSAEIRDRERKEREDAERAVAFRREAERQAEANRLIEVEKRERERVEKEREREREHEVQRERELQRERERQLERQREIERERQRDERERERERERSNWKDAAAVGLAGATVGAVVAGMAHSSSSKDNRDDSLRESHERTVEHANKSRKDNREEANHGHAPIVTQEVKPTEEFLPSEDHPSPVLDDELMDRNYFNKGRAEDSTDAIAGADREHDYYDPTQDHEELMRDFQDRYNGNASHQTMADFFTPPELHQPATGKTAVAPPEFPENEAFDPPGSVRAPPYERPYAFTATHDDHGPGSGAFAWAHHQIPSLRIIAATPPLGVKRDRSQQAAPIAPDKNETQPEVDAKDGGRSVSWGQDQTHVYQVVTPQASYENLDFRNKEAVTESSAPEPFSQPQHQNKFPVPENLKQYFDDGESKVALTEEGVEEVTTPGVEVDDDVDPPNVFSYRTPWAETMSDLAGQVYADPSSEYPSRQDAGFVEGEVFDETPKEGRMPGGFDNFDEEFGKSDVQREVESRVEELPETPNEERVVEEEPEYFTTKRDKKKNGKAKRREEAEEAARIAATAAAVPLAEKVASEIVKEKEIESEDFEMPLSKKERKKREKEKKRMSLDDRSSTPVDETVEDSARAAATAAALPAAERAASDVVNDSQLDEDFERSSSNKDKKKKKKKKRVSLDDESTPLAGERRGEFDRYVTTEPERYEEAQPRQGSQVQPEPVVSIPSNAFDDLDELVSAKTPKSKANRRSGRYNSPSAGSPLRSEVSYQDEENLYRRRQEQIQREADRASAMATEVPLPAEEDDDLASSRDLTTAREERDADGYRDSRRKEKSSKESEYGDDDNRSRLSDPLDDRGERRRDRRRRNRTDSPDGDTRSVAASEPASEPAYFYESTPKQSKHRSRRDDDDDSRSTVSTPARSDDRDSKSSGKDKKGGLFGLFKTKLEERTETKRSSKDSPTKSRFDDDELADSEKKKKKKKKHRSSDGDDLENVTVRSEGSESRRSSKYEDDFDDARSTTSSGSKRHKRRSTGDNYDDKGRQIYVLDPKAETVRRSPHDEAEKVKDSHHYHIQDYKTTSHDYLRDDRVLSGDKGLGQAHTAGTKSASIDAYAKRDKYDDKHSTKDESFLVERGEELTGLPPLPVSASQEEVAATAEDPSLDDLPALPPSEPNSQEEETPQRPQLQQRFSSSTAVPLRFRRPPGSPSAPRESLLSSPAAASPATPDVHQRRGSRPHSGDFSMHGNEFRPLYLVERNRKTPDPEQLEQLPSLPSSRTSSTASSVHDPEEYQSAQGSPVQTRDDDAMPSYDDRWVDTEVQRMAREQQMHPYENNDILDSQESTPTGPSFPADTTVPRRDVHDDESAWLENTRRLQEEAAQARTESHNGFRDAAAAVLAGGAAAMISHQMISAAAEHSALESPNRETHQRAAPAPVQEPKPEMREDDPFTWEEIETDDLPVLDQARDVAVGGFEHFTELSEPTHMQEGVAREESAGRLTTEPAASWQPQPTQESHTDSENVSEAAPRLTAREFTPSPNVEHEQKEEQRTLDMDDEERSTEAPTLSVDVEPPTVDLADRPSEHVAAAENAPTPAISERPHSAEDTAQDHRIDVSGYPSHPVLETSEPSVALSHEETPTSPPRSRARSPLSEDLTNIPTPDPQTPMTPQTPATAGKDGFDASFEDMQPLTCTRSRKSVSWPDEQGPATEERPTLTREESGLVKWFDPPRHEDLDEQQDNRNEIIGKGKKRGKGKKAKKGRKESFGDEALEVRQSEVTDRETGAAEPENVPLQLADDDDLIEPAQRLSLAEEGQKEREDLDGNLNLGGQGQDIPSFTDPFVRGSNSHQESNVSDKSETRELPLESEASVEAPLAESQSDDTFQWMPSRNKKKKGKKGRRSAEESFALSAAGATGMVAGAAVGALASGMHGSQSTRESLPEDGIDEASVDVPQERVQKSVPGYSQELSQDAHQESIERPIEEPIREPVKEPIEEPLEEPLEEPFEEPIGVPVKEPIGEFIQEPLVSEGHTFTRTSRQVKADNEPAEPSKVQEEVIEAENEGPASVPIERETVEAPIAKCSIHDPPAVEKEAARFLDQNDERSNRSIPATDSTAPELSIKVGAQLEDDSSQDTAKKDDMWEGEDLAAIPTPSTDLEPLETSVAEPIENTEDVDFQPRAVDGIQASQTSSEPITSEQATRVDPGDEWSSIPEKKNKKRNKGKKGSTSRTPPPEQEEATAAEASRDAEPSSAPAQETMGNETTLETAATAIPDGPQQNVQEEPAIPQDLSQAELEDEWSTFGTSRKGKKGKGRKRSGRSTPSEQEIPVEQQTKDLEESLKVSQDMPPPLESVGGADRLGTVTIRTAPPTLEEQGQPEGATRVLSDALRDDSPDDLFAISPTKNQNENEGKRGPVTVTNISEPEFVQSLNSDERPAVEEDISGLTEEQPPANALSGMPSTSDSVENSEVPQQASNTVRGYTAEESSITQVQAGQKGEEEKKRSEPSTSLNETDVQPAETEMATERSVAEETQAQEPVLQPTADKTSSIGAPSDPASQTDIPREVEIDEFSFAPSRKTKKGKKGRKKSGSSTPADEPQVVDPEENSFQDVIDPEPNHQLPADDSWTEEVADTAAPRAAAAGAVDVSREAEPEDEWSSSFSTKRSKKNKKGKSASLAPTPPPQRNEEPLEAFRAEDQTNARFEELQEKLYPDSKVEDPLDVGEVMTEPANETGQVSESRQSDDEWFASTTKKAKGTKKGKKSRRSLPSTPPTEAAEAQTSFRIEDGPSTVGEGLQREQSHVPATETRSAESIESKNAIGPSLEISELGESGEPEQDDSSAFTTPKRGKKGKKAKRKSGSSTPVTEKQTSFDVEGASVELAPDQQSGQSGQSTRQEPVSLTEEPVDSLERTEDLESLRKKEKSDDPASTLSREQEEASVTEEKGNLSTLAELEPEPTSEARPNLDIPAKDDVDEGGTAEEPVVESASVVPFDNVRENTEMASQEKVDALQVPKGDNSWAFGSDSEKTDKKEERTSTPTSLAVEEEPTPGELEEKQGPTAASSTARAEQQIESGPTLPELQAYQNQSSSPAEMQSEQRREDEFSPAELNTSRVSTPIPAETQFESRLEDDSTPLVQEASQGSTIIPAETQPEPRLVDEPETESRGESYEAKEDGQERIRAASFEESEEKDQITVPTSNYDELIEQSLQGTEHVEERQETGDYSNRSWDNLDQEDAPVRLDQSVRPPHDASSSEKQETVKYLEERPQEQQSHDTDISEQQPIEGTDKCDAPQQIPEVNQDKMAVDSESSFTEGPAKKSKKGKKKAKMSLAKLAVRNPGASAEELEAMLRKYNEPEAAQFAHRSPAVESEASREEVESTSLERDNPDLSTADQSEVLVVGPPDFNDFAQSSSRKSKKQTKREKEARRASLPFGESGSADVPSDAVEEQLPSYFESRSSGNDESGEHVGESMLSEDNSVVRPTAERISTGDIAQALHGQGIKVVPTDQIVDSTAQAPEQDRSSHDVDFAATVAAGLQDSGFNPDLAIDDPSFHRRASPPNAGPEADPEEVGPPISRRRKDGRRSASPQDFQTDPMETVRADDAEPSRDHTFDDAVAAGLSGAGFDAAVAHANSNVQEAEQEDFFPFKTGKKKGKKGKKSGNTTPRSVPESETPVESKAVVEEPMMKADKNVEDDSGVPSTIAPEQAQREEAEDYWNYQPKKKGKKNKKQPGIQTVDFSYSEAPGQLSGEATPSRNLGSFTDLSTTVSSEVQQVTQESSTKQDDPSTRYDGHDYNYDLPADPLEVSPSRRSKETKEDALAQLASELERRRKESVAEPIQLPPNDTKEPSRECEELPSVSAPAEQEDEWAVPIKDGEMGKRAKKSRGGDTGDVDLGSTAGLMAAGLAAGVAASVPTISDTNGETREQVFDEDDSSKPSSSKKKKGKKGKKSRGISDIQLPTPDVERERPFDRNICMEQDQQQASGSQDEQQTVSNHDISDQERELSDALDRAEQGNPDGQYATSAPAEVEPTFDENLREFSEARDEADEEMARVQTAPVQPERWEDTTPPPGAVTVQQQSDPETLAQLVRDADDSATVERVESEGDTSMSKNTKRDKKSRRWEGLQPIRTDTDELLHQQALQREAEAYAYEEGPDSFVGEQAPPPHIWVEPASTDRPLLIPRTTTGSEEMGALMMAPPYVEEVAIEQSIKHSASQEQLDSPIKKQYLKELAEDEGEFTRVKKGKKKKQKKSNPATPVNELESAEIDEAPLEQQIRASAPISRDRELPYEEGIATSEPPEFVSTGERDITEPLVSREVDVPLTRDASLEAATAKPKDESNITSMQGVEVKQGEKRPEPPTPAHAPEDVRDGKSLKESYFDREDSKTLPSTKSEELNAQGPDTTSPTSSSRVSNVFPHLQRVKRRTPSMDTEEQSQERHAFRENEKEASKTSSAAPVTTWTFLNRDSGFGTESPIVSQEPESYHNTERDSGYHDTPADSRYNRDSIGGQTDITEIEDEPSQEDHHQSNYHDGETRDVQLSGQERNETKASPVHTGTSTTSGDPLRISVEVEPDWDLSVSKRRISGATSANASELSPVRQPTEGERDIHEQDDKSEHAPPSPVDSTTKQRTSYLFNTPPSTGVRGSKESTPRNRDLPHEAVQERESPAAGAKSRKRDRATDRGRDSPGLNVMAGAAVAARVIAAAGRSDSEHGSSADKERPSSYETPADRTRPGSHLAPIEEHSPDEGPLHKRAMSDTGSPNRETKSARRTRTPQQEFREQWKSPTRDSPGGRQRHGHSTDASQGQRSVTPLSTDDLLDRLSWPPVDEEQETVGIDRVLSGDHSKSRRRESDNASPKSHVSGGSIQRIKSPTERIRSPGSFSNISWHSDTTPPLRRSNRQLSGDLRAKSRTDQEKEEKEEKETTRDSAELGSEAAVASPNFDPPLIPPPNHDRRVKAGDMSDVYVSLSFPMPDIDATDADTLLQEGTGAHPGSPMSPTRPPSVRKRQSIQIIDLEHRLDRLTSENRALQDARSKAEQARHEYEYRRDVNDHAMAETVQQRDLQLQEKDAEIHSIRELLSGVQAEVARLSEVNEGLARAKSVGPDLEEQHRTLREEHATTQQQWQQDKQELANLRDQHAYLNTNMEGIMRTEINRGLEDKDAEIRRLREELQLATQQIRSLQQQILDTKASSADWLSVNDEDYFDTACQELCTHVQSWIKRFSKWSDQRPCRLSSDIIDEKIEARLDNAVLDGSDVDQLLADRTKRRDVFMSVVMTMIWEYVFTRYLFGMDREQRQKLKALEKILNDVGPSRAVAQWRATTLTLLSNRPQFGQQKQQDTQAVTATVFDTLALLLPPPTERERELRESLQKVIGLAVDLAIQMRCQRAEYIMLPPLQPEYDANGDLSRKVTFNASLMNDRSGDNPSRSTSSASPAAVESNEELQARKAVVKIVLFPLVVKKGDDEGEGEDEIVVCPAQVLVAKEKGKRVVRVQSGAMEIDDARSVRTRASGTYSQFEGEGGAI